MKRLMILAMAATLSSAALAQSWKNYYEAGLDAAKAGKWSDARTDFLQASDSKPGDLPRGVSLPGSIFERRSFRNGAPYTPDFLAAYCGLKESIEMSGDARTGLLAQTAAEFETLINKRQFCKETFFFLDETYVLMGATDKRVALGQQYNDPGNKFSWKIDTEGISPDDEALVAELPNPTPAPSAPKPAPTPKPDKHKKNNPAPASLPVVTVGVSTDNTANRTSAPNPANTTSTVQPASSTTPPSPAPLKTKKHRKDKQPVPAPTVPATPTPAVTTATPALVKVQQPVVKPAPVAAPIVPVTPKLNGHATVLGSSSPLLGSIPTAGDKYALLIGNSESKVENGSLPFAADDAQLMRQTLITDAGYLDQNIEVVVNGTAAQIAATVNALASRVPDKATVFIYFSGLGANFDGKDYLAGVDTDTASDSSTMIAKDDVYRAFMVHGARIFAFFQANRPIQDGHYFGSECPLVGSISQMEATLPGESVYSINTHGKNVGLFTNGLVSVMHDMRSNRTPILDFGWAVFYKLRMGDTGQDGGSSNQSPSLPVLTNMASDARF